MILEYWDRISYIVQLIVACTVFIIPVRKRKNFPFIYAIELVFLTGLSFILNALYPDVPISLMIFGLVYIFACVVFVWSCLDISFGEAVYLAVCACGLQHIAFDLYTIDTLLGDTGWLLPLLIFIVVYVIGYFICARKLPDELGGLSMDRHSIVPTVTIIMIEWILSYPESLGMIVGLRAEAGHRILYRILDLICCYYALWVQVRQKEMLQLQKELDDLNAMLRQQKMQYEITQESIDSINRKCHDLKHQIQALRFAEEEEEKQAYLEGIENDIMIYDTNLQTGNKALDTVLMEKGRYCKEHQIQWTCMADGSRLDFMKPEDLYTILGNALDNAIEAVERLDDPQRKVITVKILFQNDILVMQIQNYYEGELQFSQDLPVTIKENKQDHGFGLKSIRYTAEKYNGTMSLKAGKGIFTLQVLIPVP